MSQYGDHSYRGPAPMVMGAVQGACHYCGKTGHFKRDCFKYQNDLAGGRAGNRGGGRGNGRGAGRTGR